MHKKKLYKIKSLQGAEKIQGNKLNMKPASAFTLQILLDILYLGAPGRFSIEVSDVIKSIVASRNEIPEKKKEVYLLDKKNTLAAKREYNGPYPRWAMRLALMPLFKENGIIDMEFLLQLIINADNQYAEPLVIKNGNKEKKLFIRLKEVNAILRAFEKANVLTYDLLQGEVLCVGRRIDNSGTRIDYESYLIDHSGPHIFGKQLYFNPSYIETAINLLEAVAADSYLSGGEIIYLLRVRNINGKLEVEIIETRQGAKFKRKET